jgi:hypothetical protein
VGTNYYLHKDDKCPCCGRSEEPLHIGKSSGGWCFSLHVIPDDEINTLDDWRRLWSTTARIVDEDGEAVTVAAMEKIITQRNGIFDWDEQSWHGYSDEAHFHLANRSERGPNNLLRHTIGSHCIGHGDGTYDYITGWFS